MSERRIHGRMTGRTSEAPTRAFDHVVGASPQHESCEDNEGRRRGASNNLTVAAYVCKQKSSSSIPHSVGILAKLSQSYGHVSPSR